MRLRMPEIVEDGRPNRSASSGAVKRSLRSAASNWTVFSAVRLATTAGAEDRSSKPPAPCWRYRATHFEHVRSLTSAASAAFAIDHPCSSTRKTIRSRCFSDNAALACSFIRNSLGLGLQQPPASKEDRMNNVLRNYN